MKTLFTLYFRNLWRNKQKGEIIAKLYVLFVWWVFASAVCFGANYLEFDRVISLLAPLFVAVIPMILFVPDIIFRLFMTHDSTCMNAYLRTRPVKEELWGYFLWLSKLADPGNLFLSAMALPFALIVMPIGWGLCLLLCLYLMSVFDDIVVMELRSGGPYDEGVKQSKPVGENWLERLLNRLNIRSMNDALFGIQTRSFLRSKRLKVATLVMGVYCVAYSYYSLFAMRPSFMEDSHMSGYNTYMVFFAVYMPSLLLAQYGMGIEANFFNGIWSRPLVIRRILDDKFRFYNVLTIFFSVMFIPACCMGVLSWYVLLGDMCFTIGFGNVYSLWSCFYCQPFDLMGKAFFNTQGTKSTFNMKLLLLMIFTMFVGQTLNFILPPLWFFCCCLCIGGVGLAFKRRFFDYLIRDFEKKKYKYMERYKK